MAPGQAAHGTSHAEDGLNPKPAALMLLLLLVFLGCAGEHAAAVRSQPAPGPAAHHLTQVGTPALAVGITTSQSTVVQDVLPALEGVHPDYRGLTLEHLLSCSSGIDPARCSRHQPEFNGGEAIHHKRRRAAEWILRHPPHALPGRATRAGGWWTSWKES